MLFCIALLQRGYFRYCHLPVSFNQSDHSPLTTLNNKPVLPTELPLFSVITRDCCAWNSLEIGTFWDTQTSLPSREERRNEKTGQAKEKDKQQNRASGSAPTLLAFSSTCISSVTCKISQNRIMHISYCRNPKRSTALYRSKLASSHGSTSALSLPWKHK